MSEQVVYAAKRNTQIFGVSLIVLQVVISLTYGICIVNNFQLINITSVVIPIALALLTVAGNSPSIQVSDWSSPI